MCVNYTPTRNEVWLREHFELVLPPAAALIAEVYPAGPTPLIRVDRGGRLECVTARFGLVPGWAKDLDISRHTYNARSETAASKPSFRNAWRNGQLGVVAMDAFFEPNWESGRAERWRIARSDGQPFAVPCLWETWRDPHTGEHQVSCTLLTVDAGRHPLLRRFHRPDEEKRSVVPLAPAALPAWWRSTVSDRQACLALPEDGILVAAPAPRPAAAARHRAPSAAAAGRAPRAERASRGVAATPGSSAATPDGSVAHAPPGEDPQGSLF